MSDNPPTPSFDLLTERWIPCEALDGARLELGIRDVLLRAHELRAVADASPLATIAIHRLLLAILDRALAPKDRAAWIALWKAKTLPEAPLAAYLEKWKERFDLFHPERPFLQVAKLEAVMQARTGRPPERTPLWRMILETSVHSSPAHLFERMPEDAWVRPAAAARGLLAFLLFAQGGRIQNEAESWKGGLVRGGAAVLVLGDDLSRTLRLNLLIRAEPAANDVPPWEKPAASARTVRALAGPCDQLIFPVRLVELFPERATHGWVVREVVTGAGERCDEPPADPMFAYFVRDPRKPPVALRIDADRSAWRDAHALFDASTGADQFRRPLAVSQTATLIEAGVLDRGAHLRLALFGLASDQAKILVWRAEEMPAPARLLTDPDAADALKRGLALAEDVAQDLDYKVLFVLCERALAPTERDADKGDISRLRNSLGANALFWAELGGGFPSWLLAIDRDADASLTMWKATVRRAAQAAFRVATERLGVNAKSLAAAAQAERTLHRILNEHLGPPLPADVSAPSPSTRSTSEATT